MAADIADLAVEVRLLNGEAIPLNYKDCASVGQLRERAAAAVGCPPSRLRLLLGVQTLQDPQRLAELADAAGSALLALAAVVVKPSPVLTGHGDGIIRRWDLSAEPSSSGSDPTDSVQGHGGPVLALSVDWHLGRVLSGSSDWTLRVWGLRPAGRGLDCLGVLDGHDAPVTSVCADFAEGRGISGSEDGTARLWNINHMTCLVVLEGHHRRHVCAVGLARGPAARWALSAGRDAKIHVWDLSNWRLRGHLNGHGNAVTALFVDPEGRHAVSGSKDRRLRYWNLEAMTCAAALDGHEGPVTAVVADFSADRALSASEDASLRLWDLASLECLSVLTDWRGPVTCLSAGHGLQRAASGGADGALSLWDLGGKGRRLATADGDPEMGCTLAVSIEGGP